MSPRSMRCRRLLAIAGGFTRGVLSGLVTKACLPVLVIMVMVAGLMRMGAVVAVVGLNGPIQMHSPSRPLDCGWTRTVVVVFRTRVSYPMNVCDCFAPSPSRLRRVSVCDGMYVVSQHKLRTIAAAPPPLVVWVLL